MPFIDTDISGWEALLRMLVPMCAAICLGGAALLFLCPVRSRSRRLLGCIMLAWGLAYALRSAGMVLGTMNYMKTDILAPFILIGGNLYVIILLCYPVEVLRPGWLNAKRFLIILSPYLAIVAVYYLVMYTLGETPVKLDTWAAFRGNARYFNVWYRPVILFSVTGYVFLLLCIVYRYEVTYRQWCETNYASDQNMEVSWLRYYGAGVVLIGVAYFWAVFDGSTYCYVFHNLTVQVFFCFTFYKGFFHRNPYSESFFRNTMNEEKAGEEILETESLSGLAAGTPGKPADETAFLAKLPVYKQTVEQWMEETKPYLNKDFKLTDVVRVVSLNRTYLSMIFNEGWGENFSSVVRNYRIRYAEDLLRNHPELTINEIADLCGFTSPSTFHRAFAQCHEKLTPKKFREKAENSSNDI